MQSTLGAVQRGQVSPCFHGAGFGSIRPVPRPYIHRARILPSADYSLMVTSGRLAALIAISLFVEIIAMIAMDHRPVHGSLLLFYSCFWSLVLLVVWLQHSVVN